MKTNDQIIELQMKLTETERLGDELSDIIIDLSKRLDLAERRIQILMQRATEDEMHSSSGITITDTKPPHW